MDKIYLFDSDDIKGGYLFHSATDAHGVSFDDLEEKELNKAYVKVDRKGKVLADRLFSIGNDLLVSRNLLKLFQRMNHQEFKVMPVEIDLGKEGINNNYLLLLPPKPIDILDYKKSDLKTYKEYVLSVRKWVALGRKVPDFDIFYAVPNSWVVSGKLKEEIESRNYTGNRFDEIILARQ